MVDLQKTPSRTYLTYSTCAACCQGARLYTGDADGRGERQWLEKPKRESRTTSTNGQYALHAQLDRPLPRCFSLGLAARLTGTLSFDRDNSRRSVTNLLLKLSDYSRSLATRIRIRLYSVRLHWCASTASTKKSSLCSNSRHRRSSPSAPDSSSLPRPNRLLASIPTPIDSQDALSTRRSSFLTKDFPRDSASRSRRTCSHPLDRTGRLALDGGDRGGGFCSETRRRLLDDRFWVADVTLLRVADATVIEMRLLASHLTRFGQMAM